MFKDQDEYFKYHIYQPVITNSIDTPECMTKYEQSLFVIKHNSCKNDKNTLMLLCGRCWFNSVCQYDLRNRNDVIKKAREIIANEREKKLKRILK